MTTMTMTQIRDDDSAGQATEHQELPLLQNRFFCGHHMCQWCGVVWSVSAENTFFQAKDATYER